MSCVVYTQPFYGKLGSIFVECVKVILVACLADGNSSFDLKSPVFSEVTLQLESRELYIIQKPLWLSST